MMTMGLIAVWAVLLLAAGYGYACWYLCREQGGTSSAAIRRITPRRVLYLTAAVLSTAVLIGLFQTLYNLKWISQVRLISMVMLLFPAAAIDCKFQKIPNSLLAAGGILRCAILAVEFLVSASAAVESLKSSALGAAVIGTFFLILALLFRNSIGMGDIKLFAVMGLYQGLWGAVNSVFFSLMAAFVLSVSLLITKKKSRKDTIPFGPCILLGTIVAMGLAGL